jgi:hypothetical protein
MASMDGHRFDHLTRTLANGSSRRSLLGGLLGLAALAPLRAAAQSCGTIGPGAFLAGCDLSGLDLSGVNLAGANLRGANLEGTSLDGANLSGANLSNATLIEGALDNANTAGANLRGIRWIPRCQDDQCPEGYACQDNVCTETLCLAPSDPCGAPNTACCVEQETGRVTCSTTANSSEAGEARCCLSRQSYCWHPNDCCDGYDCMGSDGTVCDSGDPNVCTAFCCTHEVGVTCQSTELDCCYPLVCTADEAGSATCQNPT